MCSHSSKKDTPPAHALPFLRERIWEMCSSGGNHTLVEFIDNNKNMLLGCLHYSKHAHYLGHLRAHFGSLLIALWDLCLKSQQKQTKSQWAKDKSCTRYFQQPFYIINKIIKCRGFCSGVNERVVLFSFSLSYIFAKEQWENRQLPSVADIFLESSIQGIGDIPVQNPC